MTDKKLNGRDNDENNKVIQFKTLAERDAHRKKEQAKQEKMWRKQYKQNKNGTGKGKKEPFINFDKITPFAGALIASMLIVHIITTVLLDAGTNLKMIYTFGFIPAAFTGGLEDVSIFSYLSPITHIFLHGSWGHLLLNGIMGMALAIFMERSYGTKITLIFFILCVLGGVIVHFILNPFGTAPVIGASGGISGLFAAALLMMKAQKQAYQSMAGHPLNKASKQIMDSRWKIIIIWVIIMMIMGALTKNLAWEAHIGGFITGAIVFIGLQKGKIKF